MTIREALGWFSRSAKKGTRASAATKTERSGAASSDARASAAESCREGELLLSTGENDAALDAFQRAIDQNDCAAGHLGQAKAYLALERIEDAADSLEIALVLEPASIDALLSLARIRSETGAPREALHLLERAQALAPDDVEVLMALASTLNRLGDSTRAVDAYQAAIKRAPRNPGPRVNLGLIHLFQLGEPVIAESHFRAALAIAPDHLEAWANLGLALHDQGRRADELAAYRDGLSIHPGNIELRWNRALAHLSAGDYRAGWDDYELRFSRRGGRNLTRFKLPAWSGSKARDQRLLVLSEQGLGDEIMFASCIPDLCGFAATVVLECAPRLETLFARSFPNVAVHGRERHAELDWLQGEVPFSAKVASGSLPRWLRQSPEDFPAACGYLRGDSAKAAEYRQRLRKEGALMAVGVSWRGGTRATRRELRSVALSALGPLFSTPRIAFVCLQHDMSDDERELAVRFGLEVPGSISADLDELAAAISSLDLVITVDNLVLHLAGALGVPAWALLGTSPEWRWLSSGRFTPWYRSVELFRAREHAGWGPMIAAVSARLHSHPSVQP